MKNRFKWFLHGLIFGASCLMLVNNTCMAGPQVSKFYQEIYCDGKQAMAENQWDTALEKFQLLNIRYPKNPYLEEAKADIILCYLKKNRPGRALHLIRNFLVMHPESECCEQVLRYQTVAESMNTRWSTTTKVITFIICYNLFCLVLKVAIFS